MGFRNPTVWIILILLIVLLFGASKLPDITRNVGKSLKIFKQEVRELSDGDAPRADQPPSGHTPPPGQAPPGEDPGPPEDPPHAPRPDR